VKCQAARYLFFIVDIYNLGPLTASLKTESSAWSFDVQIEISASPGLRFACASFGVAGCGFINSEYFGNRLLISSHLSGQIRWVDPI
jgi:hypothetical protein